MRVIEAAASHQRMKEEMKREILCLDCADSIIKKFGPNPYPGEYCKYVSGPLSRSCICDGCAKRLTPGDLVRAWSLFTDSQPYFAWETEFLSAKL